MSLIDNDAPAIRKLVMIDDNHVDHVLTKYIIERTGLVGEIVSFLSAVEALRYFSEKPTNVDLILLDINMPQMDGFEFLEAVEKSLGNEFQYPVIVMLTTSLDPRDLERANQFSFVRDYCHKPLSEEQLIRLTNLVSNSQTN